MRTLTTGFGARQGSGGDTGFFAALSPAEARRQFQISTAVAAALAATAMLALVVGVTPQPQPAQSVVKLTIEMPGHMTVLQASAVPRGAGG